MPKIVIVLPFRGQMRGHTTSSCLVRENTLFYLEDQFLTEAKSNELQDVFEKTWKEIMKGLLCPGVMAKAPSVSRYPNYLPWESGSCHGEGEANSWNSRNTKTF